jgi:AraC-like DNA-binding protein
MFHTYAPPAPLAPFVESLWVFDADANAESATAPRAASLLRQRALPTGRPELLITLHRVNGELRVFEQCRPAAGEALPAAVLRGAYSQWYRLEAAPVLSQVGVRFTAGGATPFVPVSGEELHNRHVSLEALWGARAAEVYERLLEAATPRARVCVLAQALLTQALRSHAARPLARHPAVRSALQTAPAAAQQRPIAHLAEQAGLSQHRFGQVFRAEVGLGPKQYLRVHRFMGVVQRLQRIQTGARVDWADLAVACGYYDQSHLIHEFRALAGLTPCAYVRHRRPLFPQYVLLPDLLPNLLPNLFPN